MSGIPGFWTKTRIRRTKEVLGKHTSVDAAAAALTKEFKTKCTRDSIRCALKAAGEPTPFKLLKWEEPEIHPVVHREKLDQAAADKKKINDLVQELRDAKARQTFLDELKSVKATPRIVQREKNSGLRELTAVVLASDWHVEEIVDPESVAYRNEYNLDIAEQRIERFFQGIVWNFEHHRASGKLALRDLVLWLGGDLITGYIHQEYVESNQLSPTETVCWLMPKIRDGILSLLKHLDLERIEIPCSYGNHGRCHDDQTELLTRDGWKTYNNIKVGDLVATYPLNDGHIEWQPLLDVYVNSNYDGPMVAVHTKTTDFMVTPHHRMIVNNYHDNKENIVEMQELLAKGTLGSGRFPKCPLGKVEEYTEVSDDELRLAAWIITDGSHGNQDEYIVDVRLHQSKPEGIAKIKALLARMGIEYSEFTRLREPPIICGKQVKTVLPETTFHLLRKHISRINTLLPSKSILPSWLFSLSERQFNVFLESLLDGDGHVREREEKNSVEKCLYGRKEILDQIQAIAVVNGIPARVREDNRGDFVLSLPTTRYIYINDWKESVTQTAYSGTIWCGTVKNGTLVTRRNGIPLVSGNTTDKTRILTGYANSYEWLMYKMLADEMKKGDPRVHFEITNSPHQYVEVYSRTQHFHHGDDVRYQGGVGGLAIPLLKSLPSWDMIRYSETHNIGHHHTFRDFGRAVVNGSLIGYGTYSQHIKAPFEVPQQALYFLDSKRGKCLTTPLWVSDDLDEETVVTPRGKRKK